MAFQAQPLQVSVIPAAALDPGRDRWFFYQQFKDFGPFIKVKGKTWYGRKREFSQIIENFTEDQKINTFQVIV